MAISEAIKKYLAEKYGDGSVTGAGCDELGLACMTGGALKTPIPPGHSRADICKAEVYDWCYANLGYTPAAPAAPPAAPLAPLTPAAPPYVPPAAAPTTYTEPTTGAMGYFALCSHPGGATIKIDGAEVSWKAPLCPTFGNLKVTANVSHTIVYSMAGYDVAELFDVSVPSGGVGDAIQHPGIMSAEVGSHAGYAIIKAHDSITGKELRARPSIAGITLEERFLTPYRVNLSIASTKNSKEYKIAVTYPGYEKKERTVTVTTSHTHSNPLIVDLPMDVARIWKEVEVLAEATQPAWVTGVTIPSPLIWGSRYDLKIKFIFYKKTRYRAHIDFHSRPYDWDGKLASLPARTTRISTAETGQLDPWKEENVYTITTSWTCPNTIPEGIYVIVAQLDYEA